MQNWTCEHACYILWIDTLSLFPFFTLHILLLQFLAFLVITYFQSIRQKQFYICTHSVWMAIFYSLWLTVWWKRGSKLVIWYVLSVMWWQNVGECFYTVSEVISEIRDQSTRDWLQTLPYVLKLREPTPQAVKIGITCTVTTLSCNTSHGGQK